MNFKSPSMIVFYCMMAVTIICFSLMHLVEAFSIVGSVTLFICCCMVTWWSFIRYLTYKRNVEDKRASDAYLYAEKMGDEKQAENFSYTRKQERKIRIDTFNHWLFPACMVFVTLISIFLFLITTKIIS